MRHPGKTIGRAEQGGMACRVDLARINAGDVDGDAVHGDPADNRRQMPGNLDLCAIAEAARISIRISDPDGGDTRIPVQHMGAVISDLVAGQRRAMLEDAGLPGDGRRQGGGLLHLHAFGIDTGGMQAIEGDPGAGHVKAIVSAEQCAAAVAKAGGDARKQLPKFRKGGKLTGAGIVMRVFRRRQMAHQQARVDGAKWVVAVLPGVFHHGFEGVQLPAVQPKPCHAGIDMDGDVPATACGGEPAQLFDTVDHRIDPEGQEVVFLSGVTAAERKDARFGISGVIQRAPDCNRLGQ